MSKEKAQQAVQVPPLIDGGVMLSYRCTNACRHCLYRCSPKWPDEWMSPQLARRTFAALAAEPHLQSVHIGGGEPCLRIDLVEEVVGIAGEAGVRLSYLETNAFWCAEPAQTRRQLDRLKRAGLRACRRNAND